MRRRSAGDEGSRGCILAADRDRITGGRAAFCRRARARRLGLQQCLYSLPLPQGQGSFRFGDEVLINLTFYRSSIQFKKGIGAQGWDQLTGQFFDGAGQG
jgi:hypothetical protein